jgi:hypothetical protein
MTALTVAIERRQWEVVSLRLLLGVATAAEKLPAESLTALIDLLDAGAPPRDGKRRDR